MTMRTRVLIFFPLLLGAATVVARADRSERVAPRRPLAELPMDLADWRGESDPPLTKAVLDILRADDYLMRTYYNYKADRAVANLYIGFWQSQRQGDTIHSPLNCMPGAGWEPMSKRRVLLPGSKDHTINRVVI